MSGSTIVSYNIVAVYWLTLKIETNDQCQPSRWCVHSYIKEHWCRVKEGTVKWHQCWVNALIGQQKTGAHTCRKRCNEVSPSAFNVNESWWGLNTPIWTVSEATSVPLLDQCLWTWNYQNSKRYETWILCVYIYI